MHTCEIVFILDRSGSMSGLEKDTIGGYNSLLKKQKLEKGKALITTILFDNEMEILHDRIDVKNVKLLTSKDYYVRGSTALLDTIGNAIERIGIIHKYARKEDRPEKTLFVITTDGHENASKHYNYETIKQMIQRQEKRYGWQFLFLGANIDSTKEGSRLGLKRKHTTNYVHDPKGTKVFFETLDETVSNFRESGTLNDDWDEAIRKDYRKRG